MSQATQATESNEVTLEEALKLAQGHHKTGNYILAERTYRDILRAVPDHFPTTQFLGVLLFQTRNFEEAKHFLEIATTTEPDNAQCLNNYGGVLGQLGEHEKALELYERALAVDPSLTDSLNNKAFSLWALGRYKEAEEFSRKALDINPGDIVALNNLGMALAKLVKFEEAVDAWEKAAEESPDQAMIWSNLGNLQREMGRLKESEENCRKAVEIDPDNPEALNNLANVLRDQGQLDEAIELYTRATNNKPNYHEAHANKSIALADNFRMEDAMIAARYAVAFDNDFYLGYSALVRAAGEMGEYDEAHAAAQRGVHLQPDQAESYLDLAEILLRLEQFDDAEAALQQGLQKQPDSARSYLKLSEIREQMNQYTEADDAIERGLEISPKMPALWIRRSQNHLLSDNMDEALEYIDKALELSPEMMAAKQHKAEMLISANRNDEAEVIVREMLSKKKDAPGPYSTLTSLKKFKSEDDPDFVDMMAIEDNVEKFGNYSAANYFFTVSEAYEQMKEFDKAFEYLQKANDIKRKTIPPGALENSNFHEVFKQRYTPELIKAIEGKGYDSDVPVFIVGMPRSGTTLTEQIISSHPDVYGAGELPDLGQINKRIKGDEEIDLIEMGQEYVERVKKRDKTGKSLRITDKMPGNYMYVGLIAAILPNAKIIHCMRNPIDTCLSCYKQNFARGQYWSYDLNDLAEQYKKYLALMEHWREVLPGRVLEINYEDTVGDFENQARKLIEHVGLEWDDACLEPHKQKRAVLTASKAQVTKPVYKTSVDKWKRYEEGLQPLVRELLPDQALPESSE